MVIRLVSVSDRTDLPGLHDVFHAILGWSGAISAISFAFTAKSSTASAAAHDRRRFEIFSCTDWRRFLYVCDVMDLWEWDVRVLDIQQGLKTIIPHRAWAVVAHRRRSIAAVLADID
jgi:hypothetical protein